MNTAMRIEREKHLGAGPYERTPERQAVAKGMPMGSNPRQWLPA